MYIKRNFSYISGYATVEDSHVINLIANCAVHELFFNSTNKGRMLLLMNLFLFKLKYGSF
jgi:hypothetical protein